MAVTGFFKKQDSTTIKPSYISVGGDLFRALAVGLIDDFKHTSRHPESSVKKILEQVYKYFPKLMSNQPYLTTPSERMAMLIKSGRNFEVVECIAFVLRLIAVDELLTNPLNYREVFTELSPETEKRSLIQPSTTLPKAVIHALCNVLSLKIELSHVEPDKELPYREPFESRNSDTATAFQMEIQVQSDNYFPRVKNKVDYAYVGQLAVKPAKPQVDEHRYSGSLANTINEITQADKPLLVEYKQHRRRLSGMLAAGELSIVDLFIHFYPGKTNSTTITPQYIRQLEGLNNNPVEISAINQWQDKTNQQLVNAIASWIVSKQVSSVIYDHIENKSAVARKA